MLQLVEDALKHNRIFARERKPNKIRALGIVLYHLGLSLRDISLILTYFNNVSHEAIRNWYGRYNDIFKVKSKPRKTIAIDETKIKIQGKWMFVWAAIDIETWKYSQPG